MAEGDAAIHAARPLNLQLLLGEVKVEFLPIPHALPRIPIRGQFAFVFHETGRFTHDTP